MLAGETSQFFGAVAMARIARPLLIACAAILGAAGAVAQDKPAEAPGRLRLEDLIEKAEPACVRIDVTLRGGGGIGSGFLVGKADRVVTNYHVVAGATAAKVTFSDGATSEVKGYLAFDKRRDVAVLQLESPRKATPLKMAEKLPRKGESVVAIGSPSGLSFTVTEGIVSATRDGKELKDYGLDAEGTWLQTSTPISPGSSGGPLLNLAGEVVGANSGSLASAQNLNFAICSTDIAKVLVEADRAKLASLDKLDPLPGTPGPGPTPRPGRPGRPDIPSLPVETQHVKLPAERKFTHRYGIAREEDEFDKIVWLRTQWIPLKHNDARLLSCGIRIGVPYREDGPAPAVIWEMGTTSKGFAYTGREGRHFQIAYDGESADAGDPEHKIDLVKGVWNERLTSLIKLEAFVKIVMSKSVKARVGITEYELTPDQLECLRDLASQLPTGSGPGLTVERMEIEDDPTAPASAKAKAAREKGKKAKADGSKAEAEEPKADYRTWTSANGKFKVEASLVKVADGKVYLKRKDNGKELTVPLDSLSRTDVEYLAGRK
jgi:S1-C subfamily serine protease